MLQLPNTQNTRTKPKKHTPATCWKLTRTFTHLLLTLSVTPHLFLPFSLDFPFHVSVFSEAFCRVTDTASEAPHFRCTFAAPHRRGCCLCLATCHLIHRTRCLSSKVICLGSLSSKVLFLTPKSCHQDEIILLPPSAVSESDNIFKKTCQECGTLTILLFWRNKKKKKHCVLVT